jgi:prepilin-type N-terminal cleavage/methylation domain-containing protein
MKQTNQKGVTLIELIVVMVIIAIGAALLVPNIGGWLSNYRLRSATRDVTSLMRVAQMKAVSNNLQYRINLDDADIGAGNYVLQYQTTAGWVNDGAIQRFPKGIWIPGGGITLPGKHAEFNPNSTSSTGSLTLQNSKGTQKKITLTTATGRVKIE